MGEEDSTKISQDDPTIFSQLITLMMNELVALVVILIGLYSAYINHDAQVLESALTLGLGYYFGQKGGR